MFIELSQLINTLTTGNIHGLELFFVLTMMYTFIMVYKSKKYISFDYGKHSAVSIIIPTFKDNPDVFGKCLVASINEKPNEIIVVSDGISNELMAVAKKVGFEVFHISNPLQIVECDKSFKYKMFVFPKRVGKRTALATGIVNSIGEFVLLIDADTVMQKGCMTEMLKAFGNDVGGVSSTHDIFEEQKSTFTGKFSSVMELSRKIVDSTLSIYGKLVVLDGRCSMYRTDIIRSYVSSNEYLNEKAFGYTAMTADDRQLTRFLIKNNYRSIMQLTAFVYTEAPKNLYGLIKQQLRWARSGYTYFIKDITENVYMKTSWAYIFHQTVYFMSPFLFTAAILYDIFINPFEVYNIGERHIIVKIVVTILLAILGSSMIAYVRIYVTGAKNISIRYIIGTGMFGLFIMYPLMIFACLTMYKQNSWLTR